MRTPEEHARIAGAPLAAPLIGDSARAEGELGVDLPPTSTPARARRLPRVVGQMDHELAPMPPVGVPRLPRRPC
jgi:hypothetical protein